MSYLAKFPGFLGALPLPKAEVSSVGEFHQTWIEHSLPFVSRGAASLWPAANWTSKEWRERLSAISDLTQGSHGVLSRPLAEYSGDQVGQLRTKQGSFAPLSGSDFFRELENGKSLQAYGLPLSSAGVENITDGFAPLTFLDPVPMQGRFYQSRLFLYRGLFTDWHFHYCDETVTVQLKGRKTFLLAPNDDQTFMNYWLLARNSKRWFEDDSALKGFEPGSLFSVTLEPGDVLYLPPFWWHAAEPADDEPGATVALAFPSHWYVQSDLRLTGARWNLVRAWENPARRRLLAPMLGFALLSFLRRPFGPDHLYGKVG